MNYTDIIHFWFEAIEPKQWWVKDTEFDALIKRRFAAVHAQAAAGKLAHWRDQDEGRLAEIIVLDQFSRNMFRDAPGAFAFDQQALELTKAAVIAGSHQRLEQVKTNFLLMPYMHSEALAEHQAALPLFEQYASENTLDFEHKHRAIIERFGRYPHRNAILGRQSTEEEIDFLNQPGSSF